VTVTIVRNSLVKEGQVALDGLTWTWRRLAAGLAEVEEGQDTLTLGNPERLPAAMGA
jgi:hypothetical protein